MGRTWRVRLNKAAQDFRDSILFFPVLALVLALVMFVVTSWVDNRPGSVSSPTGWGGFGFLLFAGSGAAARSVLAAIATMFTTITGVVYSVTLVTVTLSATKYGAQVIPRFEEDRLNRFVLGLFVGTVAYALLVLKTVRVDGDPFVPVVGVNVAVLLAVASLFAFVLLLGRLITYIRPTRFVNLVGQDTIREEEALYVPLEREGIDRIRHVPPPPGGRVRTLEAVETGYIANLSLRTLPRVARRLPPGSVVRLLAKPGSRVEVGDPLARIETPSDAPLDERAVHTLELAITLRGRRDLHGDPFYGVSILGDVGITTLSGGATDVGVCADCLHGLLGIATWEAGRDPPPRGYRVRGVSFDLDQQPLTPDALQQAAHVHERAVRLGFWTLSQLLIQRSAPLLRRLAEQGRWTRYQDAVEFVATNLRAALEKHDDDAATARLVAELATLEEDLRESRRHMEAGHLAHAVAEAAAVARRRRTEDLGPRTQAALEAWAV